MCATQFTYLLPENASVTDLQARLLEAQAYISQLTRELVECRNDLKMECQINQLAMAYIPEELQDIYALECPQRQVE